MVRYVLNKYQIQRLIDGKEIVDSRGRKFVASVALREKLSKVDYEKHEIIFENGELVIRDKGGAK